MQWKLPSLDVSNIITTILIYIRSVVDVSLNLYLQSYLSKAMWIDSSYSHIWLCLLQWNLPSLDVSNIITTILKYIRSVVDLSLNLYLQPYLSKAMWIDWSHSNVIIMVVAMKFT